MTIRFLCTAVLAGCLIAIGCRRAEQIRTYVVPKETASRAAPAPTSSEPTERMLAGILPDGENAWFFKVTGPLAEIDSRADQITEFLGTIRLAAEKPHPDWKLPDGWNQQPGTGMRAATITIPAEDKPLELTVTALPWTGSRDELVSNVNRWRGQMQLAPIGPPGLADCSRELAVGAATMTIVDLRGRMQSGGMMPPFAAGAVNMPAELATASGRSDDSANVLPAGHPPISPQGATGPAPFTFDAPAGWKTLAASGIRKAVLEVVDGSKQAIVTVIDFSADAGPMMADPVAQVQRWRSEVGLAPLGDAEIKDALQSIEVDGLEARYAEALPDPAKEPESKADRGTLAAMLRRGDAIWFFKITGDRDLVAAERDHFKSFVKSVRFTTPGANDGN